MSPRRRIDPDSPPLFRLPDPQPRRWGLALAAGVAGVVVAAAVAISTVVLIAQESHRRGEVRNAAVMSFVGSFMTEFTSPDPFKANDYADKILAQGTGDFAAMFKQNMNKVVIQVAQSEPTQGTVEDLGVARWNDDGSADVLVAAKTTTNLPQGKTVVSGNRWVVTATKEGQQWKVSRLIQVI